MRLAELEAEVRDLQIEHEFLKSRFLYQEAGVDAKKALTVAKAVQCRLLGSVANFVFQDPLYKTGEERLVFVGG